MAIKNFVVGSFTNEKPLFKTIQLLRTKGFKIKDVYTPFPIHGLDYVLGLRETSLHTMGFIYGALGTATAVCGMGWIFTTDWPQNIGGKPHFALPAFMPIIFELTVLFAAVGMTLTFCYLNKIMPFVKKHRFHLRCTDDYFTIVVESQNPTNEKEILNILQIENAIECQTQQAETGWWYGRYDKEQKLYGEIKIVTE